MDFARAGRCGLAPVLSFALVSPVFADAIDVTCPADEFVSAVTIHFDDDVLNVHDDNVDITLPGSYHVDPTGTMFTVQGFGAAQVMMPDRAVLESCVAEAAKQNGTVVTNSESVAYEVVNCAFNLREGRTLQAANISFKISSLDPGNAMVFIIRSYAETSSLVGEPMEIPEFPTRNCTVDAPQ